MEKKKTKQGERKIAKIRKEKVSECQDKKCPIHGNLKTRGRTFQGYVIKKFPKRIVIEFERTIYVRKYERYMKKKTKLHARLSQCFEEKINVGDYVKIMECRPLSKIIHFVVIGKVKEEGKKK